MQDQRYFADTRLLQAHKYGQHAHQLKVFRLQHQFFRSAECIKLKGAQHILHTKTQKPFKIQMVVPVEMRAQHFFYPFCVHGERGISRFSYPLSANRSRFMRGFDGFRKHALLFFKGERHIVYNPRKLKIGRIAQQQRGKRFAQRITLRLAPKANERLPAARCRGYRDFRSTGHAL